MCIVRLADHHYTCFAFAIIFNHEQIPLGAVSSCRHAHFDLILLFETAAAELLFCPSGDEISTRPRDDTDVIYYGELCSGA